MKNKPLQAKRLILYCGCMFKINNDMSRGIKKREKTFS